MNDRHSSHATDFKGKCWIYILLMKNFGKSYFFGKGVSPESPFSNRTIHINENDRQISAKYFCIHFFFGSRIFLETVAQSLF